LPSVAFCTEKSISFEAFTSPTVAEMAPLQRFWLLLEVVTIFSPRRSRQPIMGTVVPTVS
jgi:hypothetical protein